MATDDPRRLTTSIERAADVLILFSTARSPDLGVTEIANALGLSKAVVHRVLTTLAEKGFVEAQESRRYRLGPMALTIGITYLDQIDLRGLALPGLRELCDRTHETATLSLRYGWERMYVDQVTPAREVKMTVALGRRFPLHAGSSSKAFLAFLPREEQERFLQECDFEALTDRTIRDPEHLRQDLGRIRERGYATSHGERQVDAASIAAPVFDHRGRPAAAVSVCGPVERFREAAESASALLLDITRGLSLQLGYRPPNSF